MADGVNSRATYAVKGHYSYKQRKAQVLAFREWVHRVGDANNRRLSPQAIAGLMDDEFIEFPDWLKVEDPLFRSIYKYRLDPHTIRKFLNCELKINLMDCHDRSFRVMDAFMQIVTNYPPDYA